MAKVLMTIDFPGRSPTVAEAAAKLSVRVDQVDASFGVVAVDPDQGIYAVQVDEDAIQGATANSTDAKDYRGPWSNPRIEGFGPLQEDKAKPDE